MVKKVDSKFNNENLEHKGAWWMSRYQSTNYLAVLQITSKNAEGESANNYMIVLTDEVNPSVWQNVLPEGPKDIVESNTI